MERSGHGRNFAPVKEGEEIDVKIEAVGEKGDGIARKQGFVLFIPNTKEGDEVRVRVSKVLKKVGFAEVVGEAQFKPEEAAPKKEKAKVEDELIPEGNDSEDFGEEAPAEEVAEEATAEPEEEATVEEEKTEEVTEETSENTEEELPEPPQEETTEEVAEETSDDTEEEKLDEPPPAE